MSYFHFVQNSYDDTWGRRESMLNNRIYCMFSSAVFWLSLKTVSVWFHGGGVTNEKQSDVLSDGGQAETA